MPTRAVRQRVRIVTKNDLLALLNDDFARECRAIYAHAAYSERFRDSDPDLAEAAIRQHFATARRSLSDRWVERPAPAPVDVTASANPPERT